MKTLGKPEPHSDVINLHPKTLLIGYGWVGQFVHKYFTQADYYSPSLGLRNSNDQRINANDDGNGKRTTRERRWQLGFISTPTPMNPDGSCDTSYVEKAIEQWKSHVEIFIIRSTVTPGTVKWLSDKHGVRIVMQPEYVGETLGHPLVEPQRDAFIILGGKPQDTQAVAEAWARVLHANCKIRQVSAETAELCKYMENCFLATKVVFVNEFRALAEAMGVDFLTLREAWLDDPRIGRSHTLAYKENPGFSGKCLPKDLNSIAHYASKVVGQPLKLIESILKINADLRKHIKTTVPLLPTKT